MIDYKIRVEEGGKIRAGISEDYKGEIENDPKLKNLLKTIGNRDESTSDLLERIGKVLFDMIITDKKFPGAQESVREDFMKRCEKVHNTDEAMRISLKIDDENYKSYPWELLHDDDQYLCLGRKISIIRIPSHTELNESKPIENDKIKILIIVCVPKDEEQLENARNEATEIEKAFRNKFKDEALQIDVMSSYNEDKNQVPTADNIINHLDNNNYNIIHFIGHSDSDEKGTLFLLDSQGNSLPTSDGALSAMFTHKRTKNLGLVILNSCKSGVENGFSGLSRKLIDREIPCVVGMQFNVMDYVAPDFAHKFYDQLIANEFDPEEAILSCRESLYQFLTGPGDKVFGCPVIYLALNESENGKILSGLNFQLVKRTVPFIDDKIDKEKIKNPAAIIGIDRYSNGQIPLSNDIQKHVMKLKELFNKFGTSKLGEFELLDNACLVSERATLIQIRKLVSEIFRRDNKSKSILLYFTGLIYIDKNSDEAFILPYDMDQKDPFIAGLSFKEFKEIVTKCSQTSRVVLLLDCTCTDSFSQEKSVSVVPKLSNMLETFSNESKEQIIILASIQDHQNIAYVNNETPDRDSKFTSKLLESLQYENSVLGIINMLSIRDYLTEKSIPDLIVLPSGISEKLLSSICIGMIDTYQNNVETYVDNIKSDLNSAKSIGDFRDQAERIKKLQYMLANPDIEKTVDDLKVKFNNSMAKFKDELEYWLAVQGTVYKGKEKIPEKIYNDFWRLEDLCNYDSILEAERRGADFLKLSHISASMNGMDADAFIKAMRRTFQQGGQQPLTERTPSSRPAEIATSATETRTSGVVEGKVPK